MNVGLVGAGFIGRVHSWGLWALRKAGLSDVRITAVCDGDPERARTLAEPNRAEVMTLERILDSVDAVYVCTPTSSHLTVVEACADRGLPVFCEKPLGRSLDEAARVAAALERVPHQVGLVMRYAPVFVQARSLIGSGEHGRPMTVLLRDDQFFPIQGQYGSTWRADVSVAGGGALIEHSIHDVDIFRFVFGDPASVSCRTSSFFGHSGVEDLAVASFAYGSGFVANLTSIWHQVLTRPSGRRFEIFCEGAMLWSDNDHSGPLHVETSSGEQVVTCDPPPWVDELPVPEEVRRGLGQYAEASLDFVEPLAGGEAVRGPGAIEALAAHRWVDAAYRSAENGGGPIAL